MTAQATVGTGVGMAVTGTVVDTETAEAGEVRGVEGGVGDAVDVDARAAGVSTT